MKLHRLFLICLVLVTMLLLQSCGSETSGKLSLSDLVPATDGVNMTATATYIPADGKNPNGVTITFTYSVTNDAANTSSLGTIPSTLGDSGIAEFSLPVPKIVGTQTLQVTASYGGLSVTKRATIGSL